LPGSPGSTAGRRWPWPWYDPEKPESDQAGRDPRRDGAFVAGTGLNCMGCHIQGDFASDDKHEKVVARKMLEMVNALNAKSFNGAAKVTCFTCHRGEAHPKTAPDPK